MKNIYLLGFMGSGKTSSGRALANNLGLPFADTDLLVEKFSGLTAADHIRKRGLKAFRAAENSVFKTVVRSEGRVIALGGGIMPTKARGPRLKKSGVTVYLECGETALLKRLIKDPARRPLLDREGAGPERLKRAITRLLKKRRPYYGKADLKLDTSRLTPEAAAVKIGKLLGRLKGIGLKNMKSVSVNKTLLSSKRVSLICGRGLAPLPRLSPGLFAGADKFCLVTDRNCFRTFKRRFNRMLGGASGRTVVFEAPDGAKAKNFRTLERLLAFMLENGISRRSLIIAAGGGSVTDLAGLAAALYMRGIKWISVPTTLLGQTDAGIGGKTAVDLGGVKNIAGAFYQPDLTVCDAALLDTLSGSELRAGAGELVKYALIAPGKPGRTVLKNLPAALKGGKAELAALTSACAAFKLELVSRDEREETGLRETLNFGHTAGHAFEAASKGSLSHGDAVLWGMRYAAALSRKLGIMDGTAAPAVRAALQAVEPPALKGAALDFDRFNKLIRRDKKTGAHTNRFMLIVRPGVLKAVNDIPSDVLRQVLKELAQQINLPQRRRGRRESRTQ